MTANRWGVSILVAVLLLAPGLRAAGADTAGTFTMLGAPTISGVERWGQRLTVSTGQWSPKPTTVTYQWLRNGKPISGANGPTRTLALADFGTRVSVKVAVQRASYTKAWTYTAPTGPIDHRVPVSKRFTYSLAFRGPITSSTRVFADRVAAAYADPRGWRSAGIALTRVASGGSFTVVLSAASSVPSFGSPCSVTWSCRVGRYVIINQNRWVSASPSWNAAGLTLTGYRHLVVNHETGHWLGHGHPGCPGAGSLAPVMMQQSKGMNGCRFNPFPLPSERWTSR